MDDPLTLPRRMMLVSLGWQATPANDRRQAESQPIGALAYGITDRITYLAPLLLDVALLDDSPGEESGRARQPGRTAFALVLHGGLRGIGYSSTEALIVQPNLGLGVSRRVGSRLRFGADSTWYGAHNSRLREASRIGHRLLLTGQLTPRAATSVRLFYAWDTDSLAPWTEVTRHAFGVGSSLAYRPWHWLTFGGTASLASVHFPRQLQGVADPFAPLPMPGPSGGLVVWGAAWTNLHW